MFYIRVPDNLVSYCTSKINSPVSWPLTILSVLVACTVRTKLFFVVVFLPHTLLLLINVIVAE